jgi:hypothetical protein
VEGEDFDASLSRHINSYSKRLGIKLPPMKPGPSLFALIDELYNSSCKIPIKVDGKKRKATTAAIGLLIDEYDYPLIGSLGNSVIHNDMRTRLKNFYTALKSAFRMTRFVFLTGISLFNEFSPVRP